jgi:hypothetical protein
LFADKNVGIGKTVTLFGAGLSGADAGNYLATVTTTTANITRLDITGSFTASNKTYDGTTAATATGRSPIGVLGTDLVSLSGGAATFGSKDVGTNKTVALTGATLTGTGAGNYTLTSVVNTTADVTAKSITGSFTAGNKIYDGNTTASITTRSLAAVVLGDTVSLVGGTATFATATVGLGKVVTATGFSLSGDGAANYALASSTLTTTADITYAWDGFLQPINDTAHQIGTAESKFKLGQTIPAKFEIKDAGGTVVQQVGNPTFTRTANRGSCDANTSLESPVTITADTTPEYKLTGGQYLYGWSTKGLTAGEYRIYANLADGTARYVDICLTK